MGKWTVCFAGLNSGCLQLQTWFQIIPEWNKHCHLALSSFSFALRHWSPSLSFFFSLIFEYYKEELKNFNQFTVFTAIQAWQTAFIHTLMVISYLFDNEWKAPFSFCLWQNPFSVCTWAVSSRESVFVYLCSQISWVICSLKNIPITLCETWWFKHTLGSAVIKQSPKVCLPCKAILL